jgi:hypothetical protein
MLARRTDAIPNEASIHRLVQRPTPLASSTSRRENPHQRDRSQVVDSITQVRLSAA